jgi:hypothetical protein
MGVFSRIIVLIKLRYDGRDGHGLSLHQCLVRRHRLECRGLRATSIRVDTTQSLGATNAAIARAGETLRNQAIRRALAYKASQSCIIFAIPKVLRVHAFFQTVCFDGRLLPSKITSSRTESLPQLRALTL